MADNFNVLDRPAPIIPPKTVTAGRALITADLGTVLFVDQARTAQVQWIDIDTLSVSDDFVIVIDGNPTGLIEVASSTSDNEDRIDAALRLLPNIGTAVVTSVVYNGGATRYDVTFSAELGAVAEMDVNPYSLVRATSLGTSSQSEIQTLAFANTTSGTYYLSDGASTTDELDFTDNAAAIAAELDAAGIGNVDTATGDGTIDDPFEFTWVIEAEPEAQLYLTDEALSGPLDGDDTGIGTPAVTEVELTVPAIVAGTPSDFPVGSRIDIVQANTCSVKFVAAGGVTIESDAGARTARPWSVASLYLRAADDWVLFGGLVQA